MNKIVASPEQAVADIPNGATVAIAGFGVAHRFATALTCALRDQGTKELTLVCNSLGDAGATRGQILAENHQVKKLIAAFSVRPGTPTASEEQIAAGKMEVELVPQGILVERCRAGGAGLAAFYSPTGVHTDLATGREIRDFDGKPYVLEHAIHVDYALLRGYRADTLGNVQYLEGRDVILHAENGVLGYGRMVTEEHEIDPDIYNAAGQFVALKPGASFFDSVASFEMARGGRIDTVILGAYEVDQQGSVANWSTADAKRGSIGGAMDLLSGKGDLIIVMEHVDSKGRPKLRRKCTYPLTGKACVSYVVTDLALLRWDGRRFVLDAVAPGFTPKEVTALTEMDVAVAPNVRTME